jgi:hypothetical protein
LTDKRKLLRYALASAVVTVSAGIITGATAAPTSYMSVNITEDLSTTMHRMQAAKAEIEKRQQDLLGQRYDLSNHPANGVTMSGGKAIQEGVRVKLPAGVTWDSLASMTPERVAGFPARAETRRVRQVDSLEGNPGGAQGPGRVLRQGPLCGVPPGACTMSGCSRWMTRSNSSTSCSRPS